MIKNTLNDASELYEQYNKANAGMASCVTLDNERKNSFVSAMFKDVSLLDVLAMTSALTANILYRLHKSGELGENNMNALVDLIGKTAKGILEDKDILSEIDKSMEREANI